MSKRWFALVGLAAVLGIATVTVQACVSVRKSDKVLAGPVGAISVPEADAIIARARELNVAALLVVKDRRELLAWGDVDELFDIRSMRKSVNNLLIGRLSLAGKVKLDATLGQLGIDEADAPLTAVEKQATMQQLMESRSGVYHPAAREERSNTELRPKRGEHPPGTYWFYNNWDFNVLEAMTAQLSGDADWCATFARDAAPLLGVADSNARCEPQAEKLSAYAAHKVRLTPRELAKLAQIYLDGGKAGGQPVLPADWAKWSMEPVSDFHYLPDSKFNYGRLFWSVDPYGAFKQQSFMMRGAGSQYVWGVPEAGLIIVLMVRTEPLYLRKRLGLIPDDNDVWTFGGEIGSAVIDDKMTRPPRLF